MEKGSFHGSQPEPISTAPNLEDVIKRIPLPNQLPKTIGISELPPSLLKSATLESLISQNEDLMARLSVALRKCNTLEEKVAAVQSEYSGFHTEYENLRENYMVLQQKDRLAQARAQELMQESSESKANLTKLEKIYSDLFVQAQALQRRLATLERYRARVRKVTPAIQKNARRAQNLEQEIADLRHSTALTISQTTTTYETKLLEAKEMVETFRDKAFERDRIFQEKVRIENLLVAEQRQLQKLREETDNRLDTLIDENSGLRQQVKENLLLQESQRQQLEQFNSEMPALKRELDARQEQVESLQALWAHKQRELEQADEKTRSLQKLNQSLSQNLNQQRKEIQGLRDELERERVQAQEKTNTLLTEIQMLRAQLNEG